MPRLRMNILNRNIQKQKAPDLPREVVFPPPLTPTIMITAGFLKQDKHQPHHPSKYCYTLRAR